MNIYFLFSGANNEYICKYIYASENKKIYSYSYDEGYIVKSEETLIKNLQQLEERYPAKENAEKKPGKGLPPILMQKEYFDIRQALFFLNGTLDNFNNGVPARKRLPEIISPYDFEFDQEEDLGSMDEHGFGSEKAPGDVDRDDYDEKTGKEELDSNDDDDDAYYSHHEDLDEHDFDDPGSFGTDHFDDDDEDDYR